MNKVFYIFLNFIMFVCGAEYKEDKHYTDVANLITLEIEMEMIKDSEVKMIVEDIYYQVLYILHDTFEIINLPTDNFVYAITNLCDETIKCIDALLNLPGKQQALKFIELTVQSFYDSYIKNRNGNRPFDNEIIIAYNEYKNKSKKNIFIDALFKHSRSFILKFKNLHKDYLKNDKHDDNDCFDSIDFSVNG